jgi:hypothetical protein
MNKEYVITLGIGVVLLLVVSLFANHNSISDNKITGAATTADAAPTGAQYSFYNQYGNRVYYRTSSTGVFQGYNFQTNQWEKSELKDLAEAKVAYSTYTFQELSPSQVQQPQSVTSNPPAAGATGTQPVQQVTTLPPAQVAGTGDVATIGLDANGDGTPDTTLSNPGGIFTNDHVVNYYEGVATTASGKSYQVSGNTATEVKRQNNQWVATGNKVEQYNTVVVRTQGATTTYSGLSGGRTQSVSAGLTSALSVNQQGVLTYNGQPATVTNGGATISSTQNGVTSTVTAIGNNFIVNNGNEIRVAASPDGRNPLSRIPTIKIDPKNPPQGNTVLGQDGRTLVFDPATGEIIYSLEEDGFVSTTTVITANGDATVRVWDEETGDITSLVVNHPDRSRTVYDVTSGSDDPKDNPYTTYNARGEITQLKTENGDIYNVAADGKVTDSKGNAVPQDKVPKEIKSNLFWTGRTKIAQIGQTITGAEEIYASLRFANTWLDKWDGLQEWQDTVDAFIAKNYLGTEPIISRICSEWTDKTDAPSNFALGISGQVAAHIEGERSVVYDDTGGTPKAIYLYKITFAVSPWDILRKRSDILTFRVFVKGTSGEGPVQLEQGKAGSEYVKINGTSGEIRATGNNMIVRQSPNDYDTVCLDFGDSDATMSETFKNYLDSNKLCNSFVVTEDVGIASENYRSIGNFITGNWGGGSNNEQNQDNQQGRTSSESIPNIGNNGNAVQGGGL